MNVSKAPFLSVGRHVSVGFQDTKEAVISCARFDLPDIVLSDENPAQAHYDTTQATSGAERGRIDREQRRERLLESDRFRNVDPDSLEQFLQKRK